MTHQEIQQLIDRYLDGETTPAEEQLLVRALRSLCGDAVATLPADRQTALPADWKTALPADRQTALPADWQAVLLMLGELVEGEAEYDRIVAARQPKARVLSLKWPWAAASLAVAATFLLLFVFTHRSAEPTGPQQPLIAEVATPPAQQRPVEEKLHAQQRPVQKRARGTSAPHGIRRTADVALSDTLGDGIWQQKENVERALQLLADCEAAILREEQEIRNNIVEATYRGTPQPANAILVTNELGDYEVIEPRTIIEI